MPIDVYVSVMCIFGKIRFRVMLLRSAKEIVGPGMYFLGLDAWEKMWNVTEDGKRSRERMERCQLEG
jgi:hypothetical protein